MTTKQKTIALVGEVSSGKSSFLNSLANGFVSCVSLQRETFQPLSYNFKKYEKITNIINVSIELDNIHKENEMNRENFLKFKNVNQNNVESKTYSTLSHKSSSHTLGKTRLSHGCKPEDSLQHHDTETKSHTKLEDSVFLLEKQRNHDSTKNSSYILPILDDSTDFNLIDFPGLNDSEDAEEYFFKTLQTRINEIDQIIYVTDSNRAFVNSSEVDQFKRIQKLIKTEKSERFHFIDLIVLVNKFDNVHDDDLNQIYKRIHNKIKISSDKIFRFSSHAALMYSIVSNKMNIFVPEFMRNAEIQKILKNSGAILKKEGFDEMNKSGFISYNDIQIDSLFNKTNNYKLFGDWDGLLEYQQNMYTYHTEQNHKMIMNKIDLWIAQCIDRYSNINSIEKYCKQADQLIEQELINTIIDCHHRLKLNETFDNEMFNNKLELMILSIIKIYENDNVSTFRFVLLENIFQYFLNTGIRKFIIDIINTKKIISIKTLMIIYYFVINLSINIDDTISNTLIKKIFSNPEVYEKLNFYFYDVTHKEWYCGFIKVKGDYDHISWFIHNIVNKTQTPKSLHILLILSITPINYLRGFLMEKNMRDSLSKFIDKKLLVKLGYYIANPIIKSTTRGYNDTECKLEHKLFDVNDTYDNKYYDVYTKLFDRLNLSDKDNSENSDGYEKNLRSDNFSFEWDESNNSSKNNESKKNICDNVIEEII